MNKIKIFYAEKCPYCEKLMDSLTNDNIPYEKSDITGDGEKDYLALYNKIKHDEIPCIIIDKQILVPSISFKTIDEATTLIKRLIKWEEKNS